MPVRASGAENIDGCASRPTIGIRPIQNLRGNSAIGEINRRIRVLEVHFCGDPSVLKTQDCF